MLILFVGLLIRFLQFSISVLSVLQIRQFCLFTNLNDENEIHQKRCFFSTQLLHKLYIIQHDFQNNFYQHFSCAYASIFIQ